MEIELNGPDESAAAPSDAIPGTIGFPVVGIGGSAGSLEAISQILAHLPEKPGLSVVIIHHLDPSQPSHLAEILVKSARMPVIEVTGDMPLERDRIYVISPNTNLALAQGRLKVSPRTELRGLHLPIDYFLRSLAEEVQGKAIGVILSGAGSDGTFGLTEIKAAGGITFAQDEQSARFTSMPKGAVKEGVVDIVLPPAEIARELAGMGTNPYFTDPASEGGRLRVGTDEDFHRILVSLRSFSGVDFAHYRDTTLKRRILRRMAVHKLESAPAYLELLRVDPTEVQALFHDVLINVTRFFRNPSVFDALKAVAFPEIQKTKSPGSSIRIWAAGCSTGEEAYSLAMAMVEFQDTQRFRPSIRIFASDISETPTLEKARLGVYSESIEADVSEERLRRFFTREGAGYRINQDIRDMCVFARHNVASDPPFSKMDLIACRNVLIYLSPHLQRKVLPTFHYALNPVGYLVLGTSETVGRDAELYTVVDNKQKIYLKKASAVRGQHFYMPEFAPRPAEAQRPTARAQGPLDFEKAADRILLRRFSPAGILVNRDLEILQFRGRTSPYLELPQGDPSFHLVKMSAETLFLEIRGAIREADQTGLTVHRQGVKLRDGNRLREVDLEVIPVRPAQSGDSCFLVLFDEAGAEKPSAPTAGTHSESDEVAHLRLELAAAREYLKTIREQYDTINEELTSSNEEILSSNEELQSTNEELETAKEELQSTNEELTTLNDGLRVRNLELSQDNSDLNNPFGSIGMPIVILGLDACIRRYTPGAGKTLRLTQADIGRRLDDLNNGLGASDLDRDVLKVIDTLAPMNREVRDGDGRLHTLRIHPYRTVDNKVDGAVLILLDIDEAKQAERDQKFFRTLGEQGKVPTFLVAGDGSIRHASAAALSRLGYSRTELEGLKYGEVDAALAGRRFQEVFQQTHQGSLPPGESTLLDKAGRRFPVECSFSGVRIEGNWFLIVTAQEKSIG